MACVPKSEMTSASRAWQCGQRGAERGGSGFFGGGKPLLFQPAQHAEGRLVDRAGPTAPPHRVPSLPVDMNLWRFRFELFFEFRLQLSRTHAQLAVAM